MNTKIVERIRQVMDLRQMQVVRPLIEHADLIAKVKNWMCDQESRDAFEKELSFHALRQLTNDNDAIYYASSIQAQDFQNSLELAKKMHMEGNLPDLDMGSTTEYFKYYIYATTFILEQYQYGTQVGINFPPGKNQGLDQVGDVVLDCGACFGETSIWSARQGASKVYAFEPSPYNAALVQKNIEQHELQKIIEVIPLALGKETGQVCFQQNYENPGASAVNTQGADNVLVTTLDIWCQENKIKPDFIKMDIEGAEVDAIMGAQNIIKKYQPQLAICLYHRMSDMWNIPYLLKQICPEYKFWCRKNAHLCEFVLYATL